MKEVIMKVPSFSADYPKAPIYVADLVRCKECIWRDKDNQGEDYCTYVKGLADINESSFCSWGEREGE